MNIKLQFFHGSFNFFDGTGHLSHSGLTKEEAVEFARKRFGVPNYQTEKLIDKMRAIDPEIIRNKQGDVLCKLWQIDVKTEE